MTANGAPVTKRILFQIHWFLGITAGLVLALMGVTGATMSFEGEISEALSPRLYAPGVPAGPDLSPDQLIARVQADNPGYYIARLDWEMARDRSHSVRLSSSEGRGRKQGQVDRATGAWLGAPAGEGFFHLMDDLHRWLALPGGGNGIGRQITAFSAIALIFFALSGLYLRWPRQALDWRAWLVLDLRKTGRNLWRALHVVIGIWVLLFYLLSALTGLWWSYDWYRQGVIYSEQGRGRGLCRADQGQPRRIHRPTDARPVDRADARPRQRGRTPCRFPSLLPGRQAVAAGPRWPHPRGADRRVAGGQFQSGRRGQGYLGVAGLMGATASLLPIAPDDAGPGATTPAPTVKRAKTC